MSLIFGFLGAATSIYMLVIIIRVMLSWFGSSYNSGVKLLEDVTEPYLAAFRRLRFLRFGGMDFSPVLAIGLLSVAGSVFSSISRYGHITVGIVLALLASMVWSAASFVLTVSFIILLVRLIAHLTRRNIFTPFWQIVDRIASPILNFVSRLLFRGRPVQYQTGLIVSTIATLLARLVLGGVAGLGIQALARLPF
jgi:YggT family protein